MTASPDPQREKKEHPSTYVVQDRSSEQELLRLDGQDQMFTAAMGGVLPEQPDPANLQRVLDVGCGPGHWLIQTARTYPSMTELVGVDISARIIDHARHLAEVAGLSDRVHFQTGDALRMLEFRSNYFHLVNQRFGMSYLRTWDWPKLLSEYIRVCQLGGVIRITELGHVESNSAALTQLMNLFYQAFYQAGRFFIPEPDGITRLLPDKMLQHGIADVQTRTYVITYHTDPQLKQWYTEDTSHAFRTLLPFLRKWTKVPDNYEEIYQQLIHDMQQPGFEASNTILTAWGTKRTATRNTGRRR